MSVTSNPDKWDRLVLRLQSLAYRKLRGRGVAIVTVRLVLQDGTLCNWAEPQVALLEPVGNGAESRMIELLGGVADKEGE